MKTPFDRLGIVTFMFLSLGVSSTQAQDSEINGECYEPMDPTQVSSVVGAIGTFFGPDAANDFGVQIGYGFDLVNTPGVDGRSDASTIGLDVDSMTSAECAVVAMHEFGHQQACDPGDPDNLDPDTNPEWDEDTQTHGNPCGVLNHAFDGLNDMTFLGLICCETSSTAEKDAICSGWDEKAGKLRNKFYDARHLMIPPCPEAANYTADDFDPSKPWCCP